MNTRTITVVVGDEHINKGRKQSCCHCPIALAMLDAGVLSPAVHKKAFFVGGGDDLINLPGDAIKFIDFFDNGRPVEPVSFEIDIPVAALKSEVAI